MSVAGIMVMYCSDYYYINKQSNVSTELLEGCGAPTPAPAHSAIFLDLENFLEASLKESFFFFLVEAVHYIGHFIYYMNMCYNY